MSAQAIACKLKEALKISSLFARHSVLHRQKVASTNDELKLAVGKQQIMIADQQSAGRGQHQRRWHSEPGQSLLFSFSLPDKVSDFPLSLLAGLAARNALTRLAVATQPQLWLKWPNDVWLGQKKLAGILCEGSSNACEQHWVVGLGINLLPLSATNLEVASLAEILPACEPAEILIGFFAEFELLAGLSAEELRMQWTTAAARFWQLKFWVETAEGQAGFVGIPQKLQADGSLLVRCADSQKSHQLVSATLKQIS